MRFPLGREFWSKRVVQTIVVIAVVAAAGVTGYVVYLQTGCGNTLVGCGPYPYPAIQSGHVLVDSEGEGVCQTTSTSAICSFFMKTGAAGNVTVNVIDQNQQSWQGDNSAQFLIYSSDSQFINFTSMPKCGYTSAPSFNSTSCLIGIQAQTFQFNFKISANYVTPPSWVAVQPASITVMIYKSCCWP